MEKLKLFVVGNSIGDPDTWSPWFDRAIVIAHDGEEAIALSGLPTHDVAEIPLTAPMLLESKPSHAEDFNF